MSDAARWASGYGLMIGLLLITGLAACQPQTPLVEGSIAAYRDRMLAEHEQEPVAPPPAPERLPRREARAQPVPDQANLPERTALLVEPSSETLPPGDVLVEVPDPVDAESLFKDRLERLRVEQGQQAQHVVRSYQKVVDTALIYLQDLSRPHTITLSLGECVQRAIEHNYTIRIEAHNPAISQAQIVEAEAAFDVEFYLDTSWSKRDQPTGQSFVPGTSDTRTIEGGFRKLLPSGAQTSIALSQTRQKSNLSSQFQTLNPFYETTMVAQLRQPLLRNFGLDVNRSQIEIARSEFRVSQAAFVQRVRDTLLDVEDTYWRLAQARRLVVVVAESTAQNFVTWQNMKERLGHDATAVEVANSESQYQTSRVRYLEAVKNVRDAEDRLKNLINDPELKLSDELEIIPLEVPLVASTVIDHFAEVRVALDRRSEIHQARERIDIARINTAVAKNQILPQLDLTFQYEVDGLGKSADSSFDNLTTNRFISYTLGASFSYNFGERLARARWNQAHHRESQAVLTLNQVTDAVVEEVNQSIRTLLVRYEQIPPSYNAVIAAVRNLRSLQARAQRIDPTYLETELSAIEQLANARNVLLQAITDYNVGIVQLERAKGTLLEYNNIVVHDGRPPR